MHEEGPRYTAHGKPKPFSSLMLCLFRVPCTLHRVPLFNNTLPQSLGRGDRNGHAAILFRIVHEAIGAPPVPFPVHEIPASDIIRACIIETDVHEFIVPGDFKGIVRYCPFQHLLPAVGAAQGLFNGLFPALKSFLIQGVHRRK